MPSKAEILSLLQKDITALQGYNAAPPNMKDIGLGKMSNAFPGGAFPFAGLHEFLSYSNEQNSASAAFISCLVSSVIPQGALLWVSEKRKIYPPALKLYGLEPEQVIFLQLRKQKECAWAIEEALKCAALTAVVGELQELDFTASRRFQLAIESSGVGCFILRSNPKNLSTSSVSRWQVKPIASINEDGLPGLGFPRWHVQLLKVRNGKPGAWDLEWNAGRFLSTSKLASMGRSWQKQTG